MEAQIGLWSVTAARTPERIRRSRVALEADLEGWAESDPSVLADGLTIVGRQVRVDAGFIDLLGIDIQGRWVVIELKRSRLHREAIAQALDYAACLKELSIDDLKELLKPRFADLSNPAAARETMEALLDGETDTSEVAVLVAGAGVNPGLERVAEFLSSYDIPLRVVSFDVFDLPNGQQLLVREVLEDESEPTSPPVERTRRTVEDIVALSASPEVASAFRRIVQAAETAGLHPRPYTRSVMIAPKTHRNRFLVVLTPRKSGGLRINHSVEAFAEFFPEIPTDRVEELLGPRGGRTVSDEELEAEVQSITELYRQLQANEGEIEPT